MKFSLILFIIGAKLKLGSWTSASFRKKLRMKDFTLAIGTAQGRRARTYRFRGGWVSSSAGRDPSAGTELVWCNEETAVRVMLSKYDLEGFSAIGRGLLRIMGNFENALWFLELAE